MLSDAVSCRDGYRKSFNLPGGLLIALPRHTWDLHPVRVF